MKTALNVNAFYNTIILPLKSMQLILRSVLLSIQWWGPRIFKQVLCDSSFY